MWRYECVRFQGRCSLCLARDHRRSDVAHDKIPPLTVKEMSALASRFEARASSVLLRDQPQLQSDMRLAARLINEWTGRAGTAEDAPCARGERTRNTTPAVQTGAIGRTARP
jgi:hypothetical protein